LHQVRESDHVQEELFEDSKVAVRIGKWKDRQHNGRRNKDKRTNNDLENTAQNTKD